ncbi:MAG: MacS family sensor histidine kinase, partial [Nocardioides sp.]
MFRALAVLRIVVLVNAIGLNIYRADNFGHPRAGVAVVVGMAAWTVFAIWAYSDHRRRVPALLVA